MAGGKPRYSLALTLDDPPEARPVADHAAPASPASTAEEFVAGERRIPEPEGVKIHPAARIVPMMTEAEGAALERSVREQGFDRRKPLIFIATPEGEALLDGRCRLAICLRLGWRLEDVPRDLYTGDAPYSYVFGDVDGRRNLSKDMRLAAAAKAAPFIAAENRRRMAAGGRSKGKGGDASTPPSPRDESTRTTAQVAKLAGPDVGVGSAKAMLAIDRDAPEVAALMMEPGIKLAVARRLAKVAPEERAEKVAAIRGGADPATVVPPAERREPNLGRQLGLYFDGCRSRKVGPFRDLLVALNVAMAKGEATVQVPGGKRLSLQEAGELLAERLPRPKAP